MNLNSRSNTLELLDADDIPFEDIKSNMKELDTINTLLGGHAITLHGLQQLIKGRKQVHICEIGCGGGDNLLAILKHCQKKNISVRFTGIDIKKPCIDFAATNLKLTPYTEWVTDDYKMVQFSVKPDVIFSSLFCHHFTNTELVSQLQWMKTNSRLGFFINDLHRHFLAYHSIKWITALFSKSYLVKNDAPLSVARGFEKKEWQDLFKRAGIKHFSIQWKWAFRHLIVYQHANEQ